MSVSGILKKWYTKNKRDLPWRKTKNPYYIWLSEVILQQTRVDQGLPYYVKFIKEFPDVKSLASAGEDRILRLWQGLGYYSRARNLHSAAKTIVTEYKGSFPKMYSEIIKLKGIGEYTAAAIASFAFNEPKAVVDGNVYRFLARYFGVSTPIDTGQGKKIFYDIAADLLDIKDPGTHNQAIMEFGAMQCRPGIPDCAGCPLALSCVAFKEKKIDSFPVKLSKTKIKERYFDYFLIRKDSQIILNKRLAKDIWQNMYDFPLIEHQHKLEKHELLESDAFKALFGKNRIHIKHVSPFIKHILSHQRIFARFWEIDLLAKSYRLKKHHVFVKDEEIMNYALPRLIDSYLQKNS